MSDRDSNNAIVHALAEWNGVNAGPAHGVLMRAAQETLKHRAMVRWLEDIADRLDVGDEFSRAVSVEIRKLMEVGNE